MNEVGAASVNLGKAQETTLDNLLSEIEFDSSEAECYSLIKNTTAT
jgi:hypothetical protein